jgi:hypothetical protein
VLVRVLSFNLFFSFESLWGGKILPSIIDVAAPVSIKQSRTLLSIVSSAMGSMVFGPKLENFVFLRKFGQNFVNNFPRRWLE